MRYLLLLVFALLAACSSPATSPSITSVKIEASSSQLSTGQTLVLRANRSPAKVARN